jgi:hypothetical protein
MSKLTESLGIVFVVLLLIVLIGLGPVLTIFALNTLFGLAIAVNIWTWLSTLWLSGFFYALRSGK